MRFSVAMAIALAIMGVRSLQAQVVNFDVPGGAGATNYSGQGAYPDPGHNHWNPVLGGGTTAATNLLSDGVTHTPITLTSQLGGTYGTQGTQGTAAALQSPYEYNNAVLRTDTLNNVPPGTYTLYLYGINNTGTRGTTFSVFTSATAPMAESTSNTPASLTSFILNADYVIFSNVVLSSTGNIAFTWTANPNVTLAGNNEGDFSGLQLIFVSTNTLVSNAAPNFGPNVFTFNPSLPMATIQTQLSNVFSEQQNNQFGSSRYAFLFAPGQYSNLDVDLGYYTQVLGLGQMPDAVTITGDVHSDGVLANDNATVNFWRACENFAVIPTNAGSSQLEAPDTMTFAVSQDTWLRRMHIEGSLNLANLENGAYSSGGFLADSEIDSTVSSVTQQQWLSRNDIWQTWSGQVWNMVFVGVSNPPSGAWPGSKYTIITNTPLIREKPYLSLDGNSNFVVIVPALRTNSIGTSWSGGPTSGISLPISQFYLAQPALDNSATINAALNAGLNLILTPGVYFLTNTIFVTNADTIILGLGYPTLVPTNGKPAMVVSDVDGAKIGGVIFDAGTTASSSLLQVGTVTNGVNHSADPICLYDLCSRVGGEFAGTTTNCVTINARDVVVDNVWLWRADHGAGSTPYWTGNPSNSGLVVNGDYVTIYGLFCEHHQQFQTLWNGNWGRVYFYQSELPYDPPSQAAWSHNGIDGYASYKVADTVTSHQAYGLGIYAVFINCTNISCLNAIETPTNSQQVNIHDTITVYIAGNTSGSGTSSLNHIINGTGASVSGPGYGGTATANCLWSNPGFSMSASTTAGNVALSFPTESAHNYQLQYKDALIDSSWSSLGTFFGGDDTLDTMAVSPASTNCFYRVQEQ